MRVEDSRLDVAQYVSQLRSLDLPLHEHGGIWWLRHRPFFWKPAYPFSEIRAGSARPSPGRAIVGYSHLVPPGAESNKVLRFMVRQNPEGERFSLDCIISKKRNQVRKGFRCCEVRRITDIEDRWEDLRQINISVRERTGVGLPSRYYVDHYERWRSTLRALFSLTDRDWWGAFVGGRLVGYYYSYAVEGTAVIEAAKTHTEFLNLNPTDALLFTLMEDAFNNKGCRRIIYGDYTPDDDNLTRFKEQYGFLVAAFPSYLHLTPPARALLRMSGRA